MMYTKDKVKGKGIIFFIMSIFTTWLGIMITITSSVVWAFIIKFIWDRLSYTYFPTLPAQWLNLPFWHIVGFIILLNFVINLIKPSVKVEKD